MKKFLICVWLISCLFILSQAIAFAMDSDTGGDGGYKPPPYYSPQTAQVVPSYTYTPISKPPLSSYASTLEPAMVQSYGSKTPLNNGINAGVSNTPTYSSNSVPVNYTPVTSSSAWLTKPPASSTAPQPAQNPNSQSEDN
jgi:hypothetical protein